MFRLVIAFALVLSFALICSCGEKGDLAESTGTESVHAGPAPRRLPVAVRAQQPLEQLPFSFNLNPATADGIVRSASIADEALLRSGSSFDSSLPSGRVSAAGELGIFAPDWVGATGEMGDLAYAMYSFSLPGYNRLPTLEILWAAGGAPAQHEDLYVAFANFDEDRWDWYSGPDDGVLTVASFDPYISFDNDMFVCLVLLGDQASSLEELALGAYEERGLGAILSEAPPSIVPPLASAGNLPDSFDLAPRCSPLRNQGPIGSCTAFAIADGAYNFELGRIYAGLGWDFAQDKFLTAPKYLYVESGKDQQISDYCNEGRYTDLAMDYLLREGTATELNSPYLTAGEFLCDDDWSTAALGDAALLDIERFEEVPCNSAEGIQSVKQVIALQQRPLVMQVALDAAFSRYFEGVWELEGPIVGAHAMCVVGYDDDAGAAGAFKVRNSWGSDWGQSGHVWIAYECFLDGAAAIRCWTLSDDFDQAVVDRFLSEEPGVDPPTGLSASQGTDSSGIALSWNASPGADGYRVCRGSPEDVIDEVGAVTTYKDSTAQPGLCYCYWVIAVDGAMESEPSAPANGWLGPDSGWVHTWGGDSYGQANAVAADSAGGVYLLGETEAFGAGNEDVVLVKYSQSGELLWARTYGSGNTDAGYDIEVDGSGNVWIAGVYNRVALDWRHTSLLLKYDADGNLLQDIGWRPVDADTGRESDFAGLAIDGNALYCVGSWYVDDAEANNEWTIVRFDLAGSIAWSRGWDGVESDFASDVAVHEDGKVTVVGRVTEGTVGSDDCAVIQLDSAGNLLWQRIWSTPHSGISGADFLDGLVIGADDAIYCSGYTDGYGNGDCLLLRISKSGSLEWARAWDMASYDAAYGIARSAAGTIFLCSAGSSLRGGFYEECGLLEFSSAGELLRQECWGNSNDHCGGYDLHMAPGGRLLIAGVAGEAAGSWTAVAGEVVEPGETLDPLSGVLSTLGTVTYNPPGGQSSPAGTEDTGGGWTDLLVMRRAVE